jgi:hypothetical protein
MSHLSIDANSLGNLLASVSDFKECAISGDTILMNNATSGIQVALTSLSGTIGVKVAGIAFQIDGLKVSRGEVRADFKVLSGS